MISATTFKTPTLWTSRLTTSTGENEATPGPCKSSLHEVELDSTAWRAWEVLPPEELRDLLTILSPGQRVVTRTFERFVESITLNKPVFEDQGGNGKKTLRLSHQCWKASCFHTTETGTYCDSFAFGLVANRFMWGWSYNMQMVSNTQGRKDHSVRTTWSGQLNRSVRTLLPLN